MSLIGSLERRSRRFLVVGVLVIVAVVGVADYLSGYEIFFSAFYLVAVALAAWFVGKWFGVIISVLSVAIWLAGDVAAGAHYSSSFVPIWNVAVLTAVYVIVVWLWTGCYRTFAEFLCKPSFFEPLVGKAFAKIAHDLFEPNKSRLTKLSGKSDTPVSPNNG